MIHTQRVTQTVQMEFGISVRSLGPSEMQQRAAQHSEGRSAWQYVLTVFMLIVRLLLCMVSALLDWLARPEKCAERSPSRVTIASQHACVRTYSSEVCA